MKEAKAAMYETRATRDHRSEGLLLGCLRTELAPLYGDALEAPLPPQLRALVERLEASLSESDRRQARNR